MATSRRREGKEPIADDGAGLLELLPPPLPVPPEVGGHVSKRQKKAAKQAPKRVPKPLEVKRVRLAAAPAAAAAPGAPINKKTRWMTEQNNWQNASTVEEADAGLRRLSPAASGSRPQQGLLGHVQLGDSALQPYSGARVVCGIRAYEAAGVLQDNHGRLYLHSDNLEKAAAVPEYGHIAEDVFLGSALEVERQQPGYMVINVQMIVNKSDVSGLHRDSGGDDGDNGGDDGASVCTGPASMRAISRASVLLDPKRAQEEGLGGLGFSTTTSGVHGGITIDMTGKTLFASKFILGRKSPYCHQVQVLREDIVSGLYALVAKRQGPVGRKRKRLTYFEERMAEERAGAGPLQPLGDPPADVVRDLERVVIEVHTTGGEMERLHSHVAAGKAGGTASMAKEGLTETGKSKLAFDMGKTAWEEDPELMLKIARQANQAVVEAGERFLKDPAGHGASLRLKEWRTECQERHLLGMPLHVPLDCPGRGAARGAGAGVAAASPATAGAAGTHSSTRWRAAGPVAYNASCLMARSAMPLPRTMSSTSPARSRQTRLPALRRCAPSLPRAAEHEEVERQRQAELAATAAAQQQRGAEREEAERQRQAELAARAAAWRRRVAAWEAERQLLAELEAEDAREFAPIHERAAQDALLQQGWQLLPAEQCEWNPMRAAQLKRTCQPRRRSSSKRFSPGDPRAGCARAEQLQGLSSGHAQRWR